jgi:THO complex subunit 3
MAGYFDGMMKYFQANNKTKEYQVHSSKVHSVAWNCDGKKLASGSFDKTVVTFVLERDRLVRAYVDALPSSRMRLT